MLIGVLIFIGLILALLFIKWWGSLDIIGSVFIFGVGFDILRTAYLIETGIREGNEIIATLAGLIFITIGCFVGYYSIKRKFFGWQGF